MAVTAMSTPGMSLLATLLLIVPVVASAPHGQPPTASPLEGTKWQLVRFRGGDDTVLTPDDTTKYTLEFGSDARLNARIDCNRGRGTWKTSGSSLELGPLILTRAKCPPGSLHDQVVKHWSFIRSYVIRDAHLFLSLMADGGIYEFEPALQASSSLVVGSATLRERMSLPADAVFEAELKDVSRADAPAELIARTRLASPGNPPFRFTISYDPARIQVGHSYVVSGRILVGDKPMFTTVESYPVPTRGNSNTVSVLLHRVGGRATSQGRGGASQSAAVPLEKTYWKAVQLAGKPVAAADAKREAHLVFEPGGRVSGSDGCNRLQGTYELKGDAIKFGQLVGTQMACLDSGATERAFRDALQRASGLKLTTDGLELYDLAGTQVARFQAREKP
jgi:heat shock protein HslJ